jgi:glycosyltransferase involved in cell wall biosynthesis
MEAADVGAPHRLRVLHVAQSVAGGVASFLEEVCDYQSARFGSDNVRFLVPHGSQGHLSAVSRSQLAFFSPTDRSSAALLNFARSTIREMHEFKPDVLHLHSSFAGALRLCLPLSRVRPHIVYCPHGWAFGMDISAAKKRLYARVERLLARRSDTILVNSVDEHRLAMEFGLPAEKTHVVRNGIAWAPPGQRALSSERLRLAFIGRFDRQKGLDVLLDTLRRVPLPHLEFEIVGASVLGEEPDRPAGLPANVHFHGWLPRSETLELLSSVDALVMPSRWDAAPIVAIEAMRAGVPVIASNRGGLPEIVEHGVGGYIFDLQDRDALGRILANLTREQLISLGRTARRRWELEYVADRMNELTVSAYGQMSAPETVTQRRSAQANRPAALRATHG